MAHALQKAQTCADQQNEQGPEALQQIFEHNLFTKVSLPLFAKHYVPVLDLAMKDTTTLFVLFTCMKLSSEP